jgi:hypothetical protein
MTAICPSHDRPDQPKTINPDTGFFARIADFCSISPTAAELFRHPKKQQWKERRSAQRGRPIGVSGIGHQEIAGRERIELQAGGGVVSRAQDRGASRF